ncbi:ChaN family lipoprotein [Halochromatium salexigens]|uniref:Iron-regulated protein n=1 Tax=Halochromatium salexigens TaxID=49447 RepID=A0AAJ0UIJ7_HALSE|nr:ChaN family lipoprotein [Halochromatium salexigens]MBK5932156.1 iron-regulated protein [Halochromatium salexigens]
MTLRSPLFSRIPTSLPKALVLMLMLAISSVSVASADDTDPQTKVLDVSSLGELDDLIEQLADDRVVFIGETHDRYEDHLNQLAIIRGLHERGHPIAIGMESFQQPFQDQLDAYIAGDLSETQLLRETEYFERWRFDYRLYRPILRYAREQGIALIALNLPREITDQVGDGGIASLTAEETALIPTEIDREDTAYLAHLKRIFELHPKGDDASFEHFLEVQLLWDEGMAERAVRWLRDNPESQLIVLAGTGHVEYGRGIPKRVERRLPVSMSVVMSGRQRPFDPAMADYLLYPRPVDLPQIGLMGVMLDTDSEGEGVAVQGFAQQSGAREAGLKAGDRIIAIGDVAIDAYADIRIALMDSQPGQQMPVAVLRDLLVGGAKPLRFEITLQ